MCVFPGGSDSKESASQCRRCRRLGFDLWIRKIPWRREWLPAPVFLPREFHGQRSLVGSSPWGRRELNTTEQLTHSLNARDSFDPWSRKTPHATEQLSLCTVTTEARVLEPTLCNKRSQWESCTAQLEGSPLATIRESPWAATQTQCSPK